MLHVVSYYLTTDPTDHHACGEAPISLFQKVQINEKIGMAGRKERTKNMNVDTRERTTTPSLSIVLDLLSSCAVKEQLAPSPSCSILIIIWVEKSIYTIRRHIGRIGVKGCRGLQE